MKKKIIYGLIIVFVSFLGWRIFSLVTASLRQKEMKVSQQPVAVQADSVRFEPIQQLRQFIGSIHPYYRYIVSPKVSGRIIHIQKRIGDHVNRGEVIAQIDDAEYEQAVIEAEANLRIAQASLLEATSQFELLKQELDRVKSLQEKGIASPSELDAATTNFEAQKSRLALARAQVEQREASLKSANIRLGYTVLTATEPGFIGERFVDEGGLIAANSPVVSVVGFEKVIVKTTVIERDYGLLSVGQEAEVDVDAYPNKRFPGIVTRIAPVLQEASRVAQMEVEVNNDSLVLKPGMFTRVTVILQDKSAAQTVPSDAVINHAGVHGVFMVNSQDNAARFVPVETGIISPKKTEIISPRLEGLVIVLGQHLLEDGSPIIVTGMGETSTDQESEKQQ